MKVFGLILIVLLFLGAYLVRKSTQTVPYQSVWLVSRFGAFHRVLPSGLHFLIPYIDEVTHRHSIATQQTLLEKMEVDTSGGILVAFNATLHLRITDPYKASYNYVGDPMPALIILARETLKMEIAAQEYSNLSSQLEIMAGRLANLLNETAKNKQLGVTCVKCELHIPPLAQLRGAKSLAIPPKAGLDNRWQDDPLLAQAIKPQAQEEESQNAPPRRMTL